MVKQLLGSAKIAVVGAVTLAVAAKAKELTDKAIDKVKAKT